MSLICNYAKEIEDHFINKTQGNLKEALMKKGADQETASRIVKQLETRMKTITKTDRESVMKALLKDPSFKNKKSAQLFDDLINKQLLHGDNIGAINTKVSEALGLPKISTEDAKQISELTKKIKEAKDKGFSNQAIFHAQQLERTLMETKESKLAKKLDVYRYFNMLFSPGTAFVNIAGNELEFLGKIAGDTLLKGDIKGFKTLYKDMRGDLLNELTWGNLEGQAKKGFLERFKSVEKAGLKQLNVDTLQSVWGTGTERAFKSGTASKLETIGSKAETALAFELSLPDKVVRNAALASSYIRQLKDLGVKPPFVKNYKEFNEFFTKLNNGEIKGIDKDLAQEIKLVADWESAKTVFQDKSVFSKVMKSTREGLNKTSDALLSHAPFPEEVKKALRLGDKLMPFVEVPANIANQAIQRSEIGTVLNLANWATNKAGKNIFNKIDSKYVRDVKASQMLINSIATMAGWGATGGILSAMGILRPDDRGIQTFRIGKDTYLDIGFLSVVSGPMMLAADIQQGRIKDAKSYLSTLKNRIQSITSLPVFGIAKTAQQSKSEETNKFDPVVFAKNLAIQAGKQYLPINNFINQIDKVMGDEKVLDTYDRNSWNALLKQVSATYTAGKGIPKVLPKLEQKLDTAGRPITRKTDLGTRVGEFFRIIRQKDASKIDDPVFKELRRLKDEGVRLKDIFDYAKDNITIRKQKYSLTDTEKREFQKIYGQTVYNSVKEVMNTPYYKNLDPEDQNNLITKLNTRAKKLAEIEFIKKRYNY